MEIDDELQALIDELMSPVPEDKKKNVSTQNNSPDYLPDFLQEYFRDTTQDNIPSACKTDVPKDRSCFRKGHRKRVLKRFFDTDMNGFADYEILEFLLFYSIPRRDTKQAGHDLIDKFGSLDNVLAAPACRLMQTKGIGKESAAFLKLISYLTGMVYKRNNINVISANLTVPSSDILRHYDNRSYANDCISMLLFDYQQRQLGEHDFFIPPDRWTAADTKKIVESAISSGCMYVILSRLQLSGRPCLNKYDISLAKNLHELLRMCYVILVDYAVVCGKEIAMLHSADKKFTITSNR